MAAANLRTPEQCQHRRSLATAAGEVSYFCALAADRVGAQDSSWCTVRSSACQLCCEQREPREEAPNPVVATAIYKAAYKIAEKGGVPGCDAAKAAELQSFAVGFLPFLDSKTSPNGTPRTGPAYTSPCRHLGPQIGEEDCKTCLGKVRRKVFACHHPLHSRTTMLGCRGCVDYQPGEGRHAVENWVIGMTTAPRSRRTVERSLRSLRKAGWTETVHLFAEDAPATSSGDLANVNVIQRAGPPLGAWSNFLLALNELYQREPRADAYLMVQDDVVYCRGLKKYLEQSLWPGAALGVVSLHTPRHLAATTGTGFYPADLGWGAWGAQAFIFSNSAARAFLSDSQVTDHRLKGLLEGKKSVDSVVGDWCRRTKREFWLHAPSLCEHIGATSTLWLRGSLKGRRISADFPGDTKPLDRLLAARRKSHGTQRAPAIRMLNDGTIELVETPSKESRNGTSESNGVAARAHQIAAHPITPPAVGNLSTAGAGRKLLGLVIVTHPTYERHLPKLLDCVQQHRPLLDEVVLVLNGEFGQLDLPSSLHVVRGRWDSPQSARNAGLAAAQCEWMCYLDGDNLPSERFFHAMRAQAEDALATTGFLYPGTVLRVTENTEAQRVFVMPEWDDLEAREKSIVDTSSAWRVAALRSVGGWFMPCDILDDYATTLQMMRHGWRGERVPEAVAVLRHHDDRRSRAVEAIPGTLWHARRHLLLTLFAGRREPLIPLLNWYRGAELPPQTAIHWVDNSGDAKFHKRLWRTAEELSAQGKVSGVTITQDRQRLSSASFEAIHSHIASLYNHALHSVSADVVITVEDDVIPPPDALRPLVGPLQPWSTVAAVAAVYPSRDDPTVANVALETQQWSRMPKLETLPPASTIPVGMVAGGCTAWHAPALQRMLPLQVSPKLGWDGNLSARLNHAGYRLLLATSVRCAHLTGRRQLAAAV